MLSSSNVRRNVWLVLAAAALVAGDLPIRLAAVTGSFSHGMAALADDGDGGGDSDGGGDGDSDHDSDADSADGVSDADADADADDADVDADDDDDEVRARQHRRAGAGGADMAGRNARAVARTAQRPVRARAELVASGLDERTLAELGKAGFRIVRKETVDGRALVKLRIPPRMSLEAARRRVASASPGAAVDYNHYYRPDVGDGGLRPPCSGQGCFAADLIGWPRARLQDAPGCGAGVRIGLVDTAINAGHPAFGGRHMVVIRLERDDLLPDSGRQHGTAVASLLVGSAQSRAPGLLPDSEVIAVDAFHRDSARDERADAFDLVRALDLLGERGVQVVNMSLSGPPNRLLEEAVRRLKRKNIVLVAAAGNKGPHAGPLYPAAYDGVIAVTAIDRGKAVYRHANRGDYIDFAAPGVDVWAAASVSGARRKTGTSFAAPFVTAVAAVVAASHPGETPAAIQQLMADAAEDLGKPGRDPVFGWGLVNAHGLCSAGAPMAAE